MQNSNRSKDTNMKAKYLKILGGNIGEQMTPKRQNFFKTSRALKHSRANHKEKI